MKSLTKFEVENTLKVGDSIAVIEIGQANINSYDLQGVITEIIKKDNGSVKLRLSSNDVKFLYDKNRQLIRDKTTGEYKSKPHVCKRHFTSSRMSGCGIVYEHVSGENYKKTVVKTS